MLVSEAFAHSSTSLGGGGILQLFILTIQRVNASSWASFSALLVNFFEDFLIALFLARSHRVRRQTPYSRAILEMFGFSSRFAASQALIRRDSVVSSGLDIVYERYCFDIGDSECLIKLAQYFVVGLLMWLTHTLRYGWEERHI